MALKGKHVVLLDHPEAQKHTASGSNNPPKTQLWSLYTVLQQNVEKLQFNQSRKHYYCPNSEKWLNFT